MDQPVSPSPGARLLRNSGEHLKPHRQSPLALKVTVIYVVVAAAWIILSDVASEFLVSGEFNHLAVNLIKGIGFVAVTGASLYVFLHRAQRRELSLAERLREAIAASRDGLWRWDVANDDLFATPGGDTELGWEAARTIRDMAGWRAVVHPDDWTQISSLMTHLQESGDDSWQIEQRFRTKDGEWLWYQIKGHVTERTADGSVAVMEGTYHSIAELKRIQFNLERANRALRILVATYNAVSKNQTRQGIFTELVQQIATWPECAVAWIGQARDDGEKRIFPIAWAGTASKFVTDSTFRWDDSAFGQGPSGMCIKTGRPALVDNVHEDDATAPWHESLTRYGIRSGVSIPIIPDGDQRYLLHIAGRAPDLFPSEDSQTYEMISSALAVTLYSLDAEFRFTLSESARQDMAERLQKTVQGAISALATVVEKRDPYTSGHQHRVGELAVAFGKELGLGDDHLEGLRIGAWIHDVGKIGIPTEILSKPGRLDETEIALIQRHAEIGYEIVKSIDFGWPVEKIVHQHHERWDGSGYPQGLKGREIALEARIVAVADVIESMGTDRPYRPKIPWQRVLDEITSGRGTRYDAQVVDAALTVLDRDMAAFGFKSE